MNKNITLEDITFENQKFWYGFLAAAFASTAIDPETDMSLTEIIEDNNLADTAWWDRFTGYYEGVIDDADGYVENPCTIIYNLTPTQTLKIEFHPGDIVYYVNDRQIGCTGGEYKLQLFPSADLLKYTEQIKDDRIFLLLLPLATAAKQDTGNLEQKLSHILGVLLHDVSVYHQIIHSILYGLTDE